MKKTRLLYLALVVATLFLVGCGISPNTVRGTPAFTCHIVGGWLFYLWHGIIAPITFIILLFSSWAYIR